MKKNKSITGLIDALMNGARPEQRDEPSPANGLIEAEITEREADDDELAALARLGAALIERLNVPEGMSTAEIVDSVITMWKKADEDGADGEMRIKNSAHEAENGIEDEAAEYRRLPRPLRGGLSELPESDYENMSAEQFRRLKKQLKRASMDGRRVRL